MPGRLFRHSSGYPVRFKNPQFGHRVQGTIIDEIWTIDPETFTDPSPQNEEGWLETTFVAQLIEWGTKESTNQRVRIAYYTRRPGGGPKDWVFAQYCPSLGLDELEDLLRKIEKAGWFKKTKR